MQGQSRVSLKSMFRGVLLCFQHTCHSTEMQEYLCQLST